MKDSTEKKGCVIHCRVSSNKQASEGESLEAQLDVCQRVVESKGLTLVHAPWLEAYSGRKETRPVFEDILHWIDSNPGRVQYYVFRTIDRFTRSGTSTYLEMKKALMKRGVTPVDSTGIIQPTVNTLESYGFEYSWSKFSPSEISETVMANVASCEVSSILTRMIGAEIQLTQEGYKIRAPQDGYLNKKIYVGGKKRTIQEPDPDRAHFFIKMFNMRASGKYTDEEIVATLNKMGYLSKRKNRWDPVTKEHIGYREGKPLTVKQLQRIIKRPIYAGVLVEKWTHYKPVLTPYPGLVPINVFNYANRGAIRIKELANGKVELLYDSKVERERKKRTRYNPTFPYKNSVACPICKKRFSGSSSRGKSGKYFDAYHCTRKHKRYAVSKGDFDTTVETFISKISFNEELMQSVKAVVHDRYRERQKEILQSIEGDASVITNMESRKTLLLEKVIATTSEVVQKELEKQIEELSIKISNARAQRTTKELEERDIDKFLRYVQKVLEHPAKMLITPDNPKKQEDMLSLVFKGIPTYEEIAFGTPKMTWVFKPFLVSDSQKYSTVTLRGIEPRFRP